MRAEAEMVRRIRADGASLLGTGGASARHVILAGFGLLRIRL
ncbi:hypothetical protein [Acuticoccus kalidii]|nr:hypothetical protein [Acuticoccus kalidii]